eukprot:1273837-Pyramimonas_sp.AAC.1
MAGDCQSAVSHLFAMQGLSCEGNRSPLAGAAACARSIGWCTRMCSCHWPALARTGACVHVPYRLAEPVAGG